MISLILSCLVHHANRDPGFFKSDFYPIKTKLLWRYATPVDVDIQTIEGKRCFSCDGTGQHLKYYRGYSYKESYHWEDCYKCDGTGWWKEPENIMLQRWSWNGYVFHQPLSRKPGPPPTGLFNSGVRRIQGYIEKRSTPYTTESLFWLFLLYDRKAFGYMWRMLISPMPKAVGLIVNLKRLATHFRDEFARRREHLDFGQTPEPEPEHQFAYNEDDTDIPF